LEIINYLVKDKDCFNKGRIYLKETISIECASIWSQDEHFMLTISDNIDIYTIDPHEIVFLYKNIMYIYWADMSFFLEKHFKPISEMRNDKLNTIVE
jgi:hypothetical protein